MTNQIDIEKETKIYIPKITNPQILTYRNFEPDINIGMHGTVNLADNIDDVEKRR